ncbi:uncharacterized protein BCR38DRAFT_352921 [Pseudomassariella vexata]|uniref:Cyanovirin-N domain-containing protein n=1 Tax=Pseudomassariella vexata TaxID=1141098 RepID=A0A1Y2DH19_9PEZI|nr:uncharacterized protein BCR38DRAFT_352921 [Pseudomassariella vexata]ORY58553.1 hypothetical protein BCR38DRAFT_352921 [Pseudomassariella vexata]
MVQVTASFFSLLALVVVTSAEPVAPRQEVSCLDNLDSDSNANLADATDCVNELAALGDQVCEASVSGTAFCNRAGVQITGISIAGGNTPRGTSSTCNDVARGAGRVLDLCSRGDGTVKGQTPAFGNGDLIVDVRRV